MLKVMDDEDLMCGHKPTPCTQLVDYTSYLKFFSVQ